MTNLLRVRAVWSGFPGAPGISTFYFLDVNTAIESLNKFYGSFLGALPADVTINVERTGDIIEDTTGALTGSWVGGVTAPIVGTGVGPYAAASGFMFGWETGVIADGHRVRGKTFMVPGSQGVYQNNGSVLDSNIPIFTAAGTQLILEQMASFVIWHRPRKARAATATRPAVAAHLGSHALVASARVPDKAVVLRSRRD